MVTSGRCFSCDSLRDNTKGSGKKLAYPKRHTVQGTINIQELSRSFARSIWQQAGGGWEGEWAWTFQQGSAIIAAPSLRKHLRAYKHIINQESPSPPPQAGGCDSDAEVGLGWELRKSRDHPGVDAEE